jgi:predicted dehydrogenase
MREKTILTSPSRRDFLKSSTIAGGAVAAAIATRAYAAGDDTIKVGWIGCGNRGTGAAAQALNADSNIKLVAVGDAFKDRLESGLKVLAGQAKIKDKIDVAPEKQFVGFDAYKQVIDSGVDVVVLTTPPHFRPAHLAYAVEKGKHCFCEKPVAVDPTGLRSVIESVKQAKEKKLSLVSGLCWRYDEGTAGLGKHLSDGGVGQILSIDTRYNTGDLWSKPRMESWSDMEFQMRNWLYYTWLSGDHIVEQNVHNLDRCALYLGGEYPVKITSLGGRQVRTDALFGNIFDHFATIFEYKSGAKVFSYCRQQAGAASQNGDWIYGTKGTAEWGWTKATVKGDKPAEFKNTLSHAYQKEHDVLMASIRKGEAVNNGDYMVNSTAMGIAGRMAGYTGQELTWEQVLESKENLTPAAYAWGKLDFPKVALPGLTKFS